MKKLIAMIGAVAMSFCAFADEPAAKPGISFEEGEGGVNVSEGTFTPPSPAWTWASDPLELGAYADGELAAAGVYGTGFERRDDEFPQVDKNLRYLKLDTGTAELTRAMDADDGAGYVDQLVKFTGFEDPQTNLTAGIGVWMGEFVTNDTDDVELTETNLYVTVGKGAEQIALKIDKVGDDDFVAKIGQWYRLTIKPIGDVFENPEETTHRAGFIVYVNGKKVSTSDERAQALIDNPGKMTAFAKEAMENGQLFTAVTAGPAAHTLAGFKGAGAIDDIILTAEPPAFTIETVDVTFAPITGAIIASVVDSKGITVTPSDEGVYTVNPGVLTVTLAADEGYKMRGDGSGVYHPDTKNAQSGKITLDTSDVEFVEVVATVENDTVVDEYAEDELYDMITTLVDGDTATFLANAEIYDEDGQDQLYGIDADTTITVAIANGLTTWTVDVPTENGTFIDNVGADENFIKLFTFDDTENGMLTLGGEVAGALTAPNVEVSSAIEVSGVLKAATLIIDESVTLDGEGIVKSQDNELLESFLPEGKVVVSEEADGEGYYTYQIAAEPPPAEDIVTITIGGQSTSYKTTQEALEAVLRAEQQGGSEFEIIVTAIDDLTITNDNREAQVAAGGIITITPGSWAFSGALAYKGRIDGAVSATDVTVLDGGITLGANGSVTVDVDSELETDDFSADQGYKVIVEEGEGTKTFKTQQDSPTPTGKPGISFEDGESGVQGTTFDPSQATGTWTWNSSDPLEIGDHDGETLPYGDPKPPRRDTLFPQVDVNKNYLKLDTSSEELAREMDNANGYVDQLIKFTGYEDIQTNFAANTKIAVWMGEICTNEDTEAMSTNLYITVGREISGSIEQVALKIDGDYKLDSWYRLTVKPIGNIYDGQTEGSVTPRAGFAVYIDGKKIGSSDLVAKALVENPGKLSATAKALMDAGQLFTAIDDTSVGYRTVAWKGIGAIDDIILTDAQPEFTIDEYGFTINPPLGLEVESVKVGDTVLTEYKVAPNTVVTITYRAAPGYVITSAGKTYSVKIESNGQAITTSGGVVVEEAVAYVVNENDLTTTNYFVEAELLTMVNGLGDGDTATFLDAAEIYDEEDEPNQLYGIDADTTITVAIADDVTTWTVNVPTDNGSFIDNVGADEDFIKLFTFDGIEPVGLTLGGNVAGAITAPNVSAGAITVSGVLKAKTLALDDTITLSGAGMVMTTNDAFTAEEIIPGDEEGELDITGPDADGYYTYQIAAAPDTFNVTFEDAEDGSATITPLAGTSNFVANTQITVTATPATDYEYAAESYEGWEKQKDGTLTTNVTVTAAATFTAPAATEIDYAATVKLGDETRKFRTAAEALAAVVEYTKDNPDKTVEITFNKKVEKADEYAFDAGTTVEIYTDYDSEDPDKPLSTFWDIKGGDVTFLTGLENNKKVFFDEVDPDDEMNGFTLTFGGVMKAGSHVIAGDLDASNESITLDPVDCFVAIKGDLTDPSVSYKVVFADVEGYTLKEEYINDETSALKGYTVYSLEAVYDITFDDEVENGTLETSVTNGITAGTTVTVTATPDTGYECTEITTNGTAITGNTFVMPAEDVKVGATFTEIKVTAITLNKSTLELVEGDEERLIATVTPDTAKDQTIAWTTSDEDVATVGDDGTVTAVAVGTATITATNAASGKFATCTVTVSAPAPTVYFPQADIEEQYEDRNGTETKPFVIRKYDDLVALQNMVADGQTTAGVYFEQVADIDFTGKDPWTGIGAKADHPFKGVYDGQNYTISNVTFGMGDYMGFFRRAEGATIKNMTINVAGTPTAYGEGEESGVAAFVGQAYDVTLQNLTATGTIGSEACNCNHSCAGIAVRLNGGTAYACTNKCEIWCSKGKLGGIVAIGQSANMDYFTLCSNEGTLHNTKASITDGGVGGIMGWAGYSQDQNVVITDCRSIGAIVSAETAGTHTASFVGESRGKEQPPVEFAGENIAIDSIRGVGNKPELMPYGEVLGNGLIKVVTSASAFEGGKTYKTMAPDRTPAYTFTDAGTIAFNTNMYAATAFNVTAGDESLEVTETAAEGVVTFTAAIKTFNVTFKPENGSADIVSNDVAYGTAFADVAPKTLEKTGYDFAGWDPVVETIDGTELEFTAQWTAIQYTLTLTGGENVTTNVNPEKATYTYGETVAITATPKTGFTYEGVALGEGWGLNEGGAATNTVTITGNASVAIPNAKKAAITVTVKKGTGIASVSVGGTPLDFDATTSEATFEVSADAPTAQVTLEADDITIPVYKMSIGDPAVGGNVTNKTPVITADANDLSKNYVTFTAEEAKADDPQVSEAQKKQAIIDSIDDDPETHDAAVTKVNAIVTTEATPGVNMVTASQLATYITDKQVQSADLAESDYVVASVKLDTDLLITEGTEVKVNTVEKTTSDLAVTIKVGDEDATKEQIESYVEVCDDLGADVWEKLPNATDLQSAVKIEDGKLVITPVAGIDKLFLKVVIPEDPGVTK